MKKLQCEGGTLRGAENPTWLKQPQDKMWAAAGFAITAIGLTRLSFVYYRLATGKGKLE